MSFSTEKSTVLLITNTLKEVSSTVVTNSNALRTTPVTVEQNTSSGNLISRPPNRELLSSSTVPSTVQSATMTSKVVTGAANPESERTSSPKSSPISVNDGFINTTLTTKSILKPGNNDGNRSREEQISHDIATTRIYSTTATVSETHPITSTSTEQQQTTTELQSASTERWSRTTDRQKTALMFITCDKSSSNCNYVYLALRRGGTYAVKCTVSRVKVNNTIRNSNVPPAGGYIIIRRRNLIVAAHTGLTVVMTDET